MKRALILSLVVLAVTLALLIAGWTWDEGTPQACGSTIIAACS